MGPEQRPDVRRLVSVAAGVALVAGAFALAALVRQAWPLPPTSWLLVAVLSAGVFLAHTYTFILRWRGHAIATSLDETLVLVALAALPPALLPILMLAPSAFAQRARGRSVLKGAYNVSVQVVCGAIASVAFLVAARVLPAVPAAALATAVYSVVSNFGVCLVFARIEATTPFAVFRERMLTPTLLQVSIGSGAGVILVALWAYHPLALVAAAPFAFLAHAHLSSRVRAERVLLAHERIARMARVLARGGARERLAEEVLLAAGDLLPASRATLMLLTRHGVAGATWTRTFPRELREWEQLDAPLISSDGSILGALTLDVDRRDRRDDGSFASALVRLLASEAATALERHEHASAAKAAYVTP